jgi:hypothetical protein
MNFHIVATFIVYWLALSFINCQRTNFDNGRRKWDYDCDFVGGDIGSVRCAAQDCGPICADNNYCSHYTWTPYEGGTCWLKTSGSRFNLKQYAVRSSVPGIICGVEAPNGLG